MKSKNGNVASRLTAMLPIDQLADVLSMPIKKRSDLFIGGVLEKEIGILSLVRGNLDRVIVSLSIFKPSGKATPNFSKFALDDYGHTIKFGDYEASSDVVLWEFDKKYRRKTKAREKASAKGFGASPHRLRKQRGLAQSDFPGVARKTIVRLIVLTLVEVDNCE